MIIPVDGKPETRSPFARDGNASRRPGRLASVVVEELVHAIVSGNLAEGEVLPTEPTLCEEFGFSRTVIREALKLLEERGLVRVEQGRGTTVQPRDAWNLLDPVVLQGALAYDDDMSLLDNLMTVRTVVEREMARTAAARLTGEDLRALADNIAHMKAAYDDYPTFRRYDLSFHAIVMKASANEVGMAIVRTIHTHGGSTALLSSAASRAELKRTAAEHQAIYDALAARDGDLAADRIATHIGSAWAERRKRRNRLDRSTTASEA
jgi:DNA-binding FadR family transcriptional regulator